MKKIISLILCLVLVLGITATAFAATSFDPTQGGTPGTIPNPNAPMNPAPNIPSFNAVNPPRNSIIVDLTEEENPDTGAPVIFAVPAVAAVICAAAVIGKRK